MGKGITFATAKGEMRLEEFIEDFDSKNFLK